MAYVEHLTSNQESKNKPSVRESNVHDLHIPTLSLKKCLQLQSTKIKHFNRSSFTPVTLSNKKDEQGKCTSGNYGDKYPEKWIPMENVSLINHIVSSIPVILTSPDGKIKELFKKAKSRVTFRQGIQSNLNFWLPQVIDTPAISGEDQRLKIEDEEQWTKKYRDEKTEGHKESRQFEHALRANGLNLDRSNPLIHVCRTIDGDWIAISKENVIRLKQNRENVHSISIKYITGLFVETDYLAICVVLDPDKSDIEFMDIVPGLPAKTESFITSLLFALSRLAINSYSNGGLDVITVPLFKLPSCKRMSQFFSQVENGKPNLYQGVAIVESVEQETNLNDEVLLQLGSDLYHPVDIQIRGSILMVIPIIRKSNDPTLEEQIDVNIRGIASLKISETPRPHTLTINWDSKCINLSASNSATIEALFLRLRTFKECHSIIAKQPTYVIVSEYFLFVFAISKSKDLLLQNPTLNLIKLGNPDPLSILLSSSTKEADEFVDNVKNNHWWKFTFLHENECKNFSKLFFSSVDSVAEDY